MTEWSLGSGRRWCKQEVGWEMRRKNFLDISSLRETRVIRFAADNITMYGIPREKFRTIWMALFWMASICSICAFGGTLFFDMLFSGVETDRKRVLRFRLNTKTVPKMKFHFRPETETKAKAARHFWPKTKVSYSITTHDKLVLYYYENV